MSDRIEKVERRVKTVEEAIILLTQMAIRADERMDSAEAGLSVADAILANVSVKIEALTDAQIRNEEAQRRSVDTVNARVNTADATLATVSGKIDALTDAQIRNEEAQRRNLDNVNARLNTADATLANVAVKIDALTDARLRTEEAQRRTEEAFTRLAEAQAHADHRLDALIKIVRKD